jgi:hypothetical protein
LKIVGIEHNEVVTSLDEDAAVIVEDAVEIIVAEFEHYQLIVTETRFDVGCVCL